MSRQRIRGLFMSELENIENSQEVETIPTGEVSGGSY